VEYTFIDVGWWTKFTLPHPPESKDRQLADMMAEFYDDGDVKSAVTYLPDIGTYVSRIVIDPRTVNRYVFVWGEQVTQSQVWEIGERVTGQKLAKTHVGLDDAVYIQSLADSDCQISAEALRKRTAEAKERFGTSGAWTDLFAWVWGEYMQSLYIRGDNTIENAKQAGALDVHELYPDFKPKTLEEYATEFYADPPVLFDS
jgi:hypothetical protein